MGSTLKAVLFDLDGTLFDHYHSLRSAIAAIQEKYGFLAGHQREDLIIRYNAALREAYDKYLSKEIAYEETDAIKVRLFFAGLGLSEPTSDEINEFRATYKPAYRANRRATPESVDTLVRLREHGYAVAIVSNGQIEDQQTKAKVIGVRHLVDRIITSEQAGYCKPGSRIFQFAVDVLGVSPQLTHMVGDSADADIKGALDAGLSAFLYSPISEESQRRIAGKEVPVISHMSQLLGHLGIHPHKFEPSFELSPGQLVISRMGIDLVTELHHGVHMSKEEVCSLAEKMGLVLASASNKRYGLAMDHLAEMIRVIAKAAMPINETGIQISYPTQSQEGWTIIQPECHFTSRDHSIRAEYVRLTLSADSENETAMRDVAVLFQSHCNNLMRDYPRAALRDLRTAMLILAETAGVKNEVVIKGEKIDE